MIAMPLHVFSLSLKMFSIFSKKTNKKTPKNTVFLYLETKRTPFEVLGYCSLLEKCQAPGRCPVVKYLLMNHFFIVGRRYVITSHLLITQWTLTERQIAKKKNASFLQLIETFFSLPMCVWVLCVRGEGVINFRRINS